MRATGQPGWTTLDRVAWRQRLNPAIWGPPIGGGSGIAVLAGGAIGHGQAWRPAPGLAATHPVTALCLVLLAAALWPGRGHRAGGLRILGVLPVAGLVLLRLIDPPGWTLGAASARGMPAELAINTSVALLAIAASTVLSWLRRPSAAQAAAAVAVGLGFAAAVGYLDGLTRFHGGMAPATALGVMSLALAALFRSPRRGFMRALVAPTSTGRLARWLLPCSTLATVLIGWVIARAMRAPFAAGLPPAVLLAVQTTAVVALIWTVVTISTVRADRIERRRVVAERAIVRSAMTDHLTGLLSANRMWSLLAGMPRTPNAPPVCYMYVDLDHFRSANQMCGARGGDQLLIEAGRRLKAIAARHHVGRPGGDEFLVHCVGIGIEQARCMGDELVAALAQPYLIHGRNFQLTASVGISHTSSVGLAGLPQAADDALYAAKRRGGNQAVMFSRDMRDDRRRLVELEQAMYIALEREDEISLVFQPVTTLTDQTLVAVEALARWRHPRLGEVPPSSFVELAEARGLIVPLGLKLIGLAVAQAAIWHDRYPGRCPIINVNISPFQFARGDVVGDFMTLLEQHGLLPEDFCIEVTEGVMTDRRAVAALERARKLGFRVSMDDFGVGYSSLSQLPRLPLTSVKLDRSFVVHAMQSARDAAILAAIVPLAHVLQLTVVAEGVETPEQLDLIRECGCDLVQGYLVSQPLKAEALAPWLARPSRRLVDHETG